MARLLWALLAVAALTAGCASPSSPAAPSPTVAAVPVCPAPGEAMVVFLAAEDAFKDGLPTGTWSLRMEGQMEGEPGTVTLSSDPARKAFLIAGTVAGQDIDARFVHPGFSMEADGVGAQGRDHDPEADGRSFFEEFGSDGSDELGVDFGDDLGFGDFAVSCGEQGGKETLEFRHSDEDSLTTVVVERAAPHHVLGGRERDNVTRDDLRFSLSYDTPNIQVDTTLPRVPLDVTLELLTQQDTGDALTTRVRLDEGSQWAPVTEFDIAVVGADDYDMGQLYNRYRLQEGVFTMDEGAFTFEDRDDNDLLSPGDVLEVTVLHGYDFQLYDNWADGYAVWEFS